MPLVLVCALACESLRVFNRGSLLPLVLVCEALAENSGLLLALALAAFAPPQCASDSFPLLVLVVLMAAASAGGGIKMSAAPAPLLLGMEGPSTELTLRGGGRRWCGCCSVGSWSDGAKTGLGVACAGKSGVLVVVGVWAGVGERGGEWCVERASARLQLLLHPSAF